MIPYVSQKKIINFLPLLVLYILLLIFFSNKDFIQDEERYIQYANNIVEGYYTPKELTRLTNGPGYPLILVPFAIFKAPIVYAKFLNALFLFFAVYYFYLTLSIFLNRNKAIIYSYFLGLYPPVIRYLLLIQPEVFTYFLFCLFIYYLFYTRENFKKIIILGSIFGLIILTRVLFGWVALAGIIFYLSYLFIKKNSAIKLYTYIFLTALLFCLPYLTYTYSLTGKIFYWSTNSGDVLYWMSSPIDGEYGNPPNEEYSSKIFFKKFSQRDKFYSEFKNVISEYDRDSIKMKKALSNIKKYPFNYLRNCFFNTSRLIFNFPNSFEYQNPKNLAYIIPNSFLLFLFIFSIYPTIKLREHIPYSFYFILFIFIVYLGGSIFVSAVGRFSIVIVPLVLFNILYIYTLHISIKLKIIGIKNIQNVYDNNNINGKD